MCYMYACICKFRANQIKIQPTKITNCGNSRGKLCHYWFFGSLNDSSLTNMQQPAMTTGSPPGGWPLLCCVFAAVVFLFFDSTNNFVVALKRACHARYAVPKCY
ncbi:unnamed protein product [Ceratitis capitata]|uniref:(Mediterranean fruit fly) hypothetical protein n=1 Tax=Ceratitis capitata TaxID=7213 RepID=A0A811U325_CERCA|nr:unnamed protein product [Ceratitis capitata]